MIEKRITELPPDFNVWREPDSPPSGLSDAEKDKQFEDAKEKIAAIMAPYSGQQRKDVARLLKEKLDKEMVGLEADRAEKREHLAALKDIQDWCEKAELVLEQNDCSRLHLFKEAIAKTRIIGTDGPIETNNISGSLQHTFVVKHDWAKAFESASGIDDSVKLPYEICCFEFRFSGKTFIALACDDATSVQKVRFTLFVQSGNYWYAWSGKKMDDAVTVFAWTQIRAICIALDAEVATHEVVRAPHKLNEKRVKSGKAPLSDYHVVDLAKRHRVENALHGHTDRKVRLHFRRGHWRHYEDHKTWIKWMLVGDPDLGFINKRYSL